MWIKNLKIENFRCFAQQLLELQEGANILIGDNATGKTSILEALKIALGSFYFGIDASQATSPSISQNRDVRLIQNERGQWDAHRPVKVKAEGNVFGTEVVWERALNSAKGKTTTGLLADLKEAIHNAYNTEESLSLPLLAYYSTARLQSQRKETEPFRQGERYEAYYNALEASSTVSRFKQWFENQDRISYQEGQQTSALRSVSRAIQNCLPNCDRISYDARLTEIVIMAEDGTKTPFPLMSDGYQLITAMVGDIAYRCAVLNAHLEERCLEDTPGVVLIDEIEMHLHPSWQQRVVNDLARTFPKIQFVITTHSPIVLGGAKANVIRLGDPNAEDNTPESGVLAYGRSPEHIMYGEQGVKTRPTEIVNRIKEFYSLLEKKEMEEAEKILQSLFIQGFGEDDPDTVQAQRNYDFALWEMENEGE
ncbi:hypothetical protein FUAX_28570 [Fulvitalea axinellae]|uniref:ATPase AAA-type core domain-containing protein n=1 Tax=Fulvitalea axinellae TaxID=1182444 RepID=A0AAU9DDA9_9BACT|nr:hypothetical protein FUAX_28570 [Fulvitalea axinellae]